MDNITVLELMKITPSVTQYNLLMLSVNFLEWIPKEEYLKYEHSLGNKINEAYEQYNELYYAIHK